MDELLVKIKRRIPEATVGDETLMEYIRTISDRLCLRLGAEALPVPFQSICADAVVKMYRRTYYEGISSEGAANISTTFVDDILAEYEAEITSWKESRADSAGSGKVVRFL